MRSDGFRLIEAATGLAALVRTKASQPEIILVDWELPDIDGVELIGSLRKSSRAPILVISNLARDCDKVQALEAGADDYLTKPFGTAELMARIHAAFRRAAARSPRNLADSVITVGDLRVDLSRRLVFVMGAEVHLTPIEYRLFRALMKDAGAVIAHDQLVREVWGPGGEEPSDHNLRVHVSQPRQKLEEDPGVPRYLVTEPAVGYRIRGDSWPPPFSQFHPSRGNASRRCHPRLAGL